MGIKEMMDVNFRGNIYIVQNGKVLYERENGFADLQNEISNTIGTKFASASAGKAFVSDMLSKQSGAGDNVWREMRKVREVLY